MKVRLLGTGSADGWPNPFCVCDSCAVERSAGRSRGSTSAYVDDAVLIDFGPTTATSLRRAGLHLNALEHLLITHGHADHLAPEFLLWRSWVADLPTLHIWAPSSALESCRHWLGPQAPVALHEVHPGDDLVLATARGDYRARVLPASHDIGNGDAHAADAVLYDLTGPDGRRLLYATDTGPLSSALLEMARPGSFDLVLIEETFGHVVDHGTGHHDLPALASSLASLRDHGLITPSTDVVAIHLSHHNPPLPQLAVDLAAVGARAVDDGTVIEIGRTRGRRRLVTGGARSGKSHFAESLPSQHASVTYVATGGDRPDDAEWRERVAAHQSRRPSTWTTVESPDVAQVLRSTTPGTWVIVDCLTLWLTSVIDTADAWADDAGSRRRAREAVDHALGDLLSALADTSADVVLVTNEVGMDVVPPTHSGRLFRDLLGLVNTRVATHCDEVTLVVAGRPLSLPRESP